MPDCYVTCPDSDQENSVILVSCLGDANHMEPSIPCRTCDLAALQKPSRFGKKFNDLSIWLLSGLISGKADVELSIRVLREAATQAKTDSQ